MATDPSAPDLEAQPLSADDRAAIAVNPRVASYDAWTQAMLARYEATVVAQAARLAAHQAVLERLRDRAHFSSDSYSRDYAEWIDAEMATLANAAEMGKVLDALRADLAAVEAERDQYRQRANSAEARMGNYRADNRRLSEARVRVQQRNARLAALEQAFVKVRGCWHIRTPHGSMAVADDVAYLVARAFEHPEWPEHPGAATPPGDSA